jgi:hypothetical protein
LQKVSEVFSTAGTSSEISDCNASEASGFCEASEADALDIDDGISLQDVDATAAVLPPHSLRNVCVMTLLFRLCSRSMFRTKCRCMSRRWSPSAPSSLAPCTAPNLAASTSAVHPALHAEAFRPAVLHGQPACHHRHRQRRFAPLLLLPLSAFLSQCIIVTC